MDIGLTLLCAGYVVLLLGVMLLTPQKIWMGLVMAWLFMGVLALAPLIAHFLRVLLSLVR